MNNVMPFPVSRASAKLSSLSAREYQALVLASMGLKDKEIAEEMGVRYDTVRAFMRNIAMKLGTSGRTEAAALLNEYERSERLAA